MLDRAPSSPLPSWSEMDREARKAFILPLLPDHSAADIAAKVTGCTRNSIIGFIARHMKGHRLSQSNRRTNAEIMAAAERNVTRTRQQVREDSRALAILMHRKRNGNAGQPKAPAIMHRIEAATVKPPRILPIPKDLPEMSARKRLIDLGSNECKFCTGDPLTADHSFCGNPVRPGSSWCESHHRIVFPGGL